MIKLKRLVLTDYLLFKKFDWKITSHNLWVIRGVNQDALTVTSQFSGNATGKSMIFNALAALWLSQPPFSRRKNSAKELIPKKAKAKLYGSNNNVSFEIEQSFHSKVEYKIKKQDQQLEIKDISEQRKAVNSLLKLNAEHFYSFVYVHSFRPSVLQIGTSAQRYDFIESLFNLRIYDVINKRLLKLANTQKIQRMQLPKLENQFKEINITPKEQKELKAKLAKLQIQQKERINKIEKLNVLISKYTTLVTLFSSLRSEKTKTIISTELKAVKKQIAIVEEQIEKQQIALGKAKAAQAVQEKRSTLLKEKQRLITLLKKLPKFTVAEKAENDEKLQELHELLQQYKENYKDLLTWWYISHDRVISRVNTLLNTDSNINNLIGTDIVENAIYSTKEKISAYSNSINELKELIEHSKCPTCLQRISKETVHELLKNMQAKSEQQAKNLETLYQYLTIICVSKLPKKLQEIPIEEVKIEYENTAQLDIHIHEYFDAKQQYNNTCALLNELPKAVRLSASKETLLSNKKRLSALQKQAEFLSSEYAVHCRLDKEYTYKEREHIREKAKQLKEIYEKLHLNIVPLNETISKLAVAVNTGKIAIENHERLKLEIAEIESQTEDYKIIEALVEIYSPKGVRIQHIETLVSSFVMLLNSYSHSIFSEPIKFYATIKSNQFNIMAERRNKQSDINSLSGAESRQFSALAALVLRMLMPKDLQCNVMVLDEIEAGLSEVNRKYFCANFVPLLLEHVEHLVIVTPQSDKEMPLPSAQCITLNRKNGITTPIMEM